MDTLTSRDAVMLDFTNDGVLQEQVGMRLCDVFGFDESRGRGPRGLTVRVIVKSILGQLIGRRHPRQLI